jgi:hypothetical protein
MSNGGGKLVMPWCFRYRSKVSDSLLCVWGAGDANTLVLT